MQNMVEVDGSRVAVDVYGKRDGRTIVVIPGAMADAAGWAAMARQLRGWETVAVVNRRGRVPSGPLTSAYDLETEVRDAATVLGTFDHVRTLFGWSYGGLIALHVTNAVAVPHVIAYEPVMTPFGARALPDLERAEAAGDLDRTVEVALGQVAGMTEDAIRSLRSHPAVWAGLREVSGPVYAETRAIVEAASPNELATLAGRVDLIEGQRNRGRAPYGTSFEDVARRVPRATVHELAGQGHLAHLEAPDELAALVDRLHVSAAAAGTAPGLGSR